MAGEAETVEQVATILKSNCRLELSNAAFDVGDSVKFLRKEHLITDMGVEVRVSPKYLEKICDLKKTRTSKTPCSAEMAARYRGAVGSFPYLSPDRPDCQWTIANLARSMSKPTWQMFKHACHLAEYLQCASDVCQVLKWTFPSRSCLDDRVLSREEAKFLQAKYKGERDLIESVSDSDWAGRYDRVSSSCGHVFLNGNAVFCLVRKQGETSLSSCEADLISCCSLLQRPSMCQRLSSTP